MLAELAVGSRLIAHFGSKEQLQLATIRAARAIFVTTVIEPALLIPAGLGRLQALLETWLEYSSDRRFPRGLPLRPRLPRARRAARRRPRRPCRRRPGVGRPHHPNRRRGPGGRRHPRRR